MWREFVAKYKTVEMSYLYPWIISSLISCNKYAPKSIKVTFFQINVFKNCTFLRVRRSTICDTRQQTAPPKNKVHVPRKSLHSQIPKTKRATNIRWNVSFMPNLVRTDHWPHIKAINQSGNCQFIKIICSIHLWEENNYKVKKKLKSALGKSGSTREYTISKCFMFYCLSKPEIQLSIDLLPLITN